MTPPTDPSGGAASGLRMISPWRELGASSIDRVAAAGRVARVRRGETLSDRVGLALSGVIAVVDRMVDGRQTISQLLHPGDLFDLGTAPIEPSEALTALTAASYVALDEEVWRGLLGADRRLADASYARLGEQTRRLRRHISAIAFTTPLERLSATLLELRRRAPDGTEAAGQDPRLALEIRRRDLSEHVGLKPETVSRSFRQLEQEGVIAIEEKGLLRMIDVAELERIAQGGRPRASTRG